MTPEEFLATAPDKYSDWFGKGDSHSDYADAIEGSLPPNHIYKSDHMLLLVWPDRFVVTGYDGNDYTHCWEFKA